MEQVLLLNSNEEPLHITTWRRALVLLLKGKAVECIDKIKTLDNYIKIDNTFIPKVIRLKYSMTISKQELPYSRENILKRDNYTCQYCGKQLSSQELTLDHVFPKSRLGPDMWENIVACCKECNQYKANHTPKEAGMKLLRRPERPTNSKLFELTQNASQNLDTWKKYYKYTTTLNIA